jgi:hypothetical protein
MSSLLILVTLYASIGDISDAPTTTSEGKQAQPRRYHEIDADIRDALRAEALAETDGQRGEAVHQIVAIYQELRRDPRLATSDTLKKYKAKLWSRMTRVKRDLERKLNRQARSAERDGDREQLEAIEQATRNLATQVSMMNYTMGGPSYILERSGGAFGGRASFDHSQELIDLIQRTIKPDSWDVHGGPGSMFYYRPLMALVVRATSEVHGNVGGLLRAMRQAGP